MAVAGIQDEMFISVNIYVFILNKHIYLLEKIE